LESSAASRTVRAESSSTSLERSAMMAVLLSDQVWLEALRNVGLPAQAASLVA
jgi:hypothetical protein